MNDNDPEPVTPPSLSASTGVPIYQVDSFATRAFAGNPAGVCLLDAPREDAWLQGVAVEMNVSETAFLVRNAQGYDLRWFTPAAEVDLCGHATLAAAHVLWTEIGIEEPVLQFQTRSGILTAKQQSDGIELDFPATPANSTDIPAGLVDALGINASDVAYCGRTPFDVLLELRSVAQVRAINPDFPRVAECDARGVIVTAEGGPSDEATGIDFSSRFFAPRVGVDEDPVTGSAHCALAPFWAGKLNRQQLVGRQISARGGTVGVEVVQDRVLLRGQAITVMRGRFVA